MRPLATALTALTLALSLGACERATKPEPVPHASSPITEGTPDPAPAANAPAVRPVADAGSVGPEAVDAGSAGVVPARPPRGTSAAPQGSARYTVRDSGVRCMAAPCPSYLAARADAPGQDALPVHELDLSALGLSDEAQARLLEDTTRGGVEVEATVETRRNAGPAGDATVLRVTRRVK